MLSCLQLTRATLFLVLPALIISSHGSTALCLQPYVLPCHLMTRGIHAENTRKSEYGLYEADAPFGEVSQSSRFEAAASHRSNQEGLGAHQEEQTSESEKQARNHCGRQVTANLRQQKAGHVSDDQGDQQASERSSLTES